MPKNEQDIQELALPLCSEELTDVSDSPPSEWEIAEKRRDDELMQFVEDFLNSEEYAEILKERENRDNRAEIMEPEPVIVLDEPEDKHPLTKSTQKKMSLERALERYLKKKGYKRSIKQQEKSIEMIRKKIAEAGAAYLCHKKEREELRKEKLLEFLEKKMQDNPIVKKMTKPRKLEIAQRVLCYQKVKRFNSQKKRERNIEILRKLVREYQRQKEIDDMRNKTYDYKVKRKERIIKDMEVIGTKIELLERKLPGEEIADVDTKVEAEEKVEEEIVKPPKKTKEKKDKKNKKTKKGDKKSKSSKSKKPKKQKKGKSKSKSKGSKKKKKKTDDDVEPEFCLPEIPITNERRKIQPDDVQGMEDAIQSYNELQCVTANRRALEDAKKLMDGVTFSSDDAFIWSPKVLEFEDFVNGFVYKKALTITNVSPKTKRFRFLKTVASGNLDPDLIQVNQSRIKNMVPGIPFQALVTFSPISTENVLEAQIIFLSYSSETSKYSQFNVPVVCTPLSPKLSMEPKYICFEKMPVWKAEKLYEQNYFKTFKIKNLGKKSCIVVLRKLFEIEEILSQLEICAEGKEKGEEVEEEETYNYCSPNCSAYAVSAFIFVPCVVELDAKTEKTVKVFFKNVDHVGDYYEKFVLEVTDGENVIRNNTQELIISAETTGKFIVVTPEILDFGNCVYDSVYQLSFAITNYDRVTHFIRIKFPAALRDCLRASTNDVLVTPQNRIWIYVKFIPRREILYNENPYYNAHEKVLEFPIHVCVKSKNCLDTPPTKILAFAILTEALGVVIRPICKLTTKCIGCNEIVMNMGDCTTKETVVGKFGISNESYVVQHFGFLDLPQSIMLSPNYGFGSLQPMESKVLKVCFSPEARDIPNYAMEGDNAVRVLKFKIAANTIKNIGGIKKSLDYKKVRNSLKKLELELLKPPETALIKELRRLSTQLQEQQVVDSLFKISPETDSDTESPETGENEHGNSTTKNYSTVSKPNTEKYASSVGSNSELASDKTPEQENDKAAVYKFFDIPQETNVTDKTTTNNSQTSYSETINPEEEEDIRTSELWIKATIVDTLCELSHQHVVFPATPCGSYSIMTVELKALKNIFDVDCNCGYLKRYSTGLQILDYDVKFRILGGTQEIFMEPTCGTLTAGEKLKLTIVGKPEIPAQVIEDQAKALKVIEIREKKRLELEMKTLRQAGQKKSGKKKDKKTAKKKEKGNKKKPDKTKGKDKKGKKGKSTSASEKTETGTDEPKTDEIPEIIVDDSEVVLTYLDYYPAEMCVWRAMEPYEITANFMCMLEYKSDSIQRKSETLYLTTVCKVVRPCFITDLTTQHIDFGPVAIGVSTRTIVSVRNILYEPINIFASVLSPVGPFVSFNPQNLKLDGECLLKLPVAFSPTQEKTFQEYFEIKSGRTVCPIILTGEGVQPNITLTPQITVSRITASSGGYSDCTIEINNQCKASVFIRLEKIAELEGKIEETQKETKEEAKPSTKKEGKDKKKKEAKGKKGKDKKGKGKKGKGAKTKLPSKPTDELTEDELNSLKTNFVPRLDANATYFHVVGDDNKEGVTLAPFSKKSVKVRFGIPPPPPPEGQGKKKGKGKKDKKAKGSSKSSSKSKSKSSKSKSSKSKSSKSSKSGQIPEIYYVAKYNILLGNSTFLKDLIVIGAFT